MALKGKDVLALVAAGAVGIFVAPIAVPVVLRLGRPAAKVAVKGAILAYQRARQEAAEFAETVEDLVAEARSEIATEDTAVPQATAPALNGEGH